MAKPGSLPRWSETAGGTQSNIVEPSSGKKDVGWADDEQPPAKWFNWWKNLVYRWLKYLDTIHTEPFTGATSWTQLHTFLKKVTTSAGVGTNHEGVNATGDGSGAGVKGKGGDTAGTPGVSGLGGDGGGPGVKGTALGSYPGVDGTGAGSGAGVKGTGGATNGPGVEGIGTGSGAGIKGTGGATNAPGVDGTGTGTGAGIKGTGGSGGAPGVEGTGANSNPGVKGTGHGGAPGVQGIGGSGGGNGGTFTGSADGHGVSCTGDGVGYGGTFAGGASGGGVYCVGNTGIPALTVHTGHAQFTGSQPTKSADPGYNNLACGTNQTKAWGWLKSGAGTAVIEDGYNASVTLSANAFVVAFARNMANANYSVTVTQDDYASQTKIWKFVVQNKTTSGFEINVYQIGDSSAWSYAVPTLGSGDADDIGVSFKVCARQ